jgi:hypothetical protein
LQRNGNPAFWQAVPQVWVLQSPHSGDNTQLRALAGALGWPTEVKRLVYRRSEGVLRLFSRASLAGVDLGRSSSLLPPWPDLVLCSGRGAEAVAFWLRSYGNPKLRIVFVGSPWASPERFDLVVTTPQYRLPRAANILHNLLPLHDVTPQLIESEASRWREALSGLPQPYTAVLIGGSSGPYRFTPGAAARLGRQASAMARQSGGSLLVTTSARTGKAATAALASAIDVPHVLHDWQDHGGDNPFHAFLGLAGQIVVTADSVSMLAEAVSTGKPVFMFDIEEGPFSMRAEERMAEDLPPIGWRGRGIGATLFRFLINHAPPRFSRDLRIVHRELTAGGQASWLGEAARVPRASPPDDGLTRAVARIHKLFAL